MKVSADRHTCTVSSLCVYKSPEVFDQDDDGHVILLDSRPRTELHESVRDAARSCPTRSITVEEDGDG
ncbi:ferredoxin [Streptomyces sp. NPDC001262]|uniref:ferredoxin n=1 Tax=Streptomyces TaxID=1883 RepID=UPI0036A2DBB4